MALSQLDSTTSDIRSMASQEQAQHDRPPRRTPMACVRCRARKVKVSIFIPYINAFKYFLHKCSPLQHRPEQQCQRCYDGDHVCKYLSVAADEERSSSIRMSLPRDQEPAPENHVVVPGGLPDRMGPALSHSSRLQFPSEVVASSPTISTGASYNEWVAEDLPVADPANVGYGMPPSYQLPTYQHMYGLDGTPPAPFPHDGEPWSQMQGHPSHRSHVTSSPPAFHEHSNTNTGYGYSGTATLDDADRGMRAEVVQVFFYCLLLGDIDVPLLQNEEPWVSGWIQHQSGWLCSGKTGRVVRQRGEIIFDLYISYLSTTGFCYI